MDKTEKDGRRILFRAPREYQMKPLLLGSELENEELERYEPENLNELQREIFDYVVNDPTRCVVIQAGPGTGKTFTLRTICKRLGTDARVIIYKHDLLYPFRFTSDTSTIANFFMHAFDVDFYAWKSIVNSICFKMNGVEYLAMMLGLLNGMRPAMSPSSRLIILDEYTVIPTSLLAILLIYLRHFGYGVILCGDKNQLQTINTSSNTDFSGYSIATLFAERVFSLDRNVRCADASYNRIVRYFCDYSTDTRLSDWTFGMIAALFPRQLTVMPMYRELHMAATHRELTQTVHNCVMRERIPCSFYYIDVGRVRNRENVNGVLMSDGTLEPELVTRYREGVAKDPKFRPDKFLPYLPLQVGARYYLNTTFTRDLVTLLDYDPVDNAVEVLDATGHASRHEISSKDDMIAEAHYAALTNNCKGRLRNFPLYPYNIMTTYKAQGCTISEPLHLVLSGAMNHQGLYVCLSRVTDPERVRSITMPRAVRYLAAVINSVPSFMQDDASPLDDAIAHMSPSFVVHDADEHALALPVFNFLHSRTNEERSVYRRQIERQLNACDSRVTSRPLTNREYALDSNLRTLRIFVENRRLFELLASVYDTRDRCVWLHEYVRAAPEMGAFNDSYMAPETAVDRTTKRGIENIVNAQHRDVDLRDEFAVAHAKSPLVELTKLDYMYSIRQDTMTYIEKHGKLIANAETSDRVLLRGEYRSLCASTKFQYEVYTTLRDREEDLTVDWLLDRLGSMVSSPENLAACGEFVGSETAILGRNDSARNGDKRPPVEINANQRLFACPRKRVKPS